MLDSINVNMDKVYFNGVVDQALFTAHMASIKLEFSSKPLKIKWEGIREEPRERENRRHPADGPTRIIDEPSGMPSALRGVHR
jgi:hypothetical protein